jgi:hypothetical protein
MVINGPLVCEDFLSITEIIQEDSEGKANITLIPAQESDNLSS